MTREEAVSIIEERIHVTEHVESSYVDCVDIEALRMAIKALEQPEQKVGKWESQKGGGYRCSECGRYALDEIEGNYIHVAARTPYCPYCGKKMINNK